MDYFKDQATIITFVLLFMPGFVSTRIFDLLVPGQPRDYGKTIYEVVGYSCITYALWSWALLPIYFGYSISLRLAIALAVCVLLVTPVLLPIVYLKGVRGWLASRVIDPTPSSWDWCLQANENAMILVHLRDGRKVGGTWAGTAFASSYPVPPDLFLSEVWTVDQGTGQFLARTLDTKGLFMWGSDIEMLEFFDLDSIGRSAHA